MQKPNLNWIFNSPSVDAMAMYRDVQSVVRFISAYIIDSEPIIVELKHLLDNNSRLTLLNSCNNETHLLYLAMDEFDQRIVCQVFEDLLSDYIPRSVIDHYLQLPYKSELQFRQELIEIEAFVIASGGRPFKLEFRYRLGIQCN